MSSTELQPTGGPTVAYGYCRCGCGEKTMIATRTKSARGQFKGEPLLFLRGHNHRRGTSIGTKAFYVSEGRTYVMARKEAGSMLYSRVLMWDHLGRKPRPDEIVHHINENRADDRIENLQVVTRAEHIEIHRASNEAARLEGIRKRRQRVTALCKGCGEPYERIPAVMAKNRGYCSTACTGEARRTGAISQGPRAKVAA